MIIGPTILGTVTSGYAIDDLLAEEIKRLADCEIVFFAGTGGDVLLAGTWLKEDDMPLGDLAGRLGYQSEAAFSRAFKRLVGISPGAARRNPSGANTVGGPATVQ